MRRIGVAERRARLAVRHHLAANAMAKDPVEAATGVVALHATDPATVFLQLWARTRAVKPQNIEQALYEDRSLLRMIGMRRTMFVVPVVYASAVQAACSKAIAAVQRRRYLGFFADAGVGDADWLAEVEQETLDALTKRGEATGSELSADVPRLRTKLLFAEGKAYESTPSITTWVLFLLGADGKIVRGRPSGSWISSQYRWSPAGQWLSEPITEEPTDEARVDLVRRWLASYGPGTIADLRWWTGLTATQIKHALTTIEPVEVDLDGVTGLVLPDDVDPVPEPKPWVALLPALDATAMGWTQRAWYVGGHAPALFDRSGNIGPTIWSDGRIVGGWAQRADGEIMIRLLDDVGAQVTKAVQARAAQLSDWMGEVRVKPRFRTPLEKELSA